MSHADARKKYLPQNRPTYTWCKYFEHKGSGGRVQVTNTSG
jgi:hypothetical protein